MFDEVERTIEAQVRNFITVAITAVVNDTPGEGVQWPDGTSYQPTGRLRGGWNFSTSEPPPMTDRFDGGPYDLSGAETIAQMTAQIHASPMVGRLYAWNDVAYGYVVHEGLGPHRGRPMSKGFKWVQRAAQSGHVFANKAGLKVG